jgi:hypothetical protein
MKEKIYLNTPICSKIPRNGLSSGFPFPGSRDPGSHSDPAQIQRKIMSK